MDYEKKYNEALERAKAYHRNELAGSRKEMTEYIFPELRESEDERMMREFNDWLCEEIECRTNDLRDEKDRRTLNMLCYILTKVKDWLEKQKEPTKEELYAEVGTTEKEYIANTMKMVRAMREKKQEQKPAEIDFEDWDTLGYIRDIVRKHVRRDEEFNVLDKWLTEHYVNQKSAWGEEDEKMARFYEDDYNNNLGNMPMRDVIENRIKFKDWLLNRLKSLRPSWKPSEEQMKGLKFFLDFHRPQRNAGTTNWREYDAVESLYEQLKKL